MKQIPFPAALVAFAISAMGLAAPASAQALHTWVSGAGDDANPCSRVAPCHSFAGAYAKTAAYGEISCLDPGGFGSFTITQPITINCKAANTVVQAPAGGNGIGIATALPVVIRGVDVEGPGNTGININGLGHVTIEHCRVNGFGGAAGVLAVNSTLAVIHSEFTNNAVGIELGSQSASIRQVLVSGSSGNGIYLNIPATIWLTGTASISRTESAHNGGAAFAVHTGTGKALMSIDASGAAHNATGIAVDGALSTALFSQTATTGNVTGVTESAGGSAVSYQDNLLDANSATGHGANNGAYATAPLH